MFVALTLGSSLVGRTTFLGVDILGLVSPWRAGVPITETQVPYLGDTVDGFAPQASLIVDEAREGSLAEWNPYVQGGVELGGLPNPGVYSPVAAPWWVLPHEYAPVAVKLLEIAVVATGMSLLLRRLGLARPTWPLATLVYVASGFMVTWTNWPQTRVAAFVPLLFWALERAAARPRAREVLIVGAVVASLLLGGFPAVAGYALYAGAAYLLVRAAFVHRAVGGVIKAGAVSLGGVLFGGLLASWLMLPFAWNAATVIDFEARAQTPAHHLPFEALATAMLPHVLGRPDGTHFGGGPHPVEAMTYVGAATVVLVGAALAVRTRRRVSDVVLIFMTVLLFVSVLLVFVGGPILGLLQQLPVFSNNPVARLRVMIGFVAAVLAAYGAHALLAPRGLRHDVAALRDRGSERWSTALRLVLATSVAVVAVAAVQAVRARAADKVFVGLEVREGALVTACAIVLVLLAWAGARRWTSVVAMLGVFALVTVPAIDVARGWWPQVDLGYFYPSTPAIAFLDEHLDGQRYAAVGQTMLPGSSTAYRQRSLGGHAFVTPEWREVLLAADPDSMLTPTYAGLNPGNLATSLRSGMLDRFAVEYVVMDTGAEIPGSREAGPDAVGRAVLREGETITSAQFTGPVRGVVIDLANLESAAGGAEVSVTLRGVDGTPLAVTSTWTRSSGAARNVALAGESIPPGTAWVAEVAVRGEGAQADVAVDGDGRLATSTVRPADDGLRVVHTGDATVYERAGALPRVRWASGELVETDLERRIEVMNDPTTSPDVVVLEDPDDARGLDGSSTAVVTELTADTDHVTAEVSASGPGWVVFAESLRREGWHATVDGEPVPLVAAEHAGGAVFVEPGEHVVELEYRTPFLRVGVWVSLGSVLVLVVGGLLVLVRDRRAAAARATEGA
ncbi:YfhO family protein [Isoptericola variabilis]|uniref:YfhO family protein n=1 Tax=Isoptericola variabilis (strain 225) TaxID=743718 RepID=F6FS25_ISOV2|nr:YfhO family protein [Isoptericola variabilis]AEG45122.1 Protein of unknown function, membrane YfhO [Isoptericola variabilis 225]